MLRLGGVLRKSLRCGSSRYLVVGHRRGCHRGFQEGRDGVRFRGDRRRRTGSSVPARWLSMHRSTRMRACGLRRV